MLISWVFEIVSVNFGWGGGRVADFRVFSIFARGINWPLSQGMCSGLYMSCSTGWEKDEYETDWTDWRGAYTRVGGSQKSSGSQYINGSTLKGLFTF